MDNAGRFVKGHIPWIKGKKGIRLSHKTEFKKGRHYSLKTEFKKGEHCGSNHLRWKGGRCKIKIGYIIVYAPGHPRAYRNKVYEHIIVAEKKLGRYLKKTERVHHINGIKDDNRPSNIFIFKSQKEHMKNHFKGKKREGARGKWLSK